jgi:hypothetical protein
MMTLEVPAPPAPDQPNPNPPGAPEIPDPAPTPQPEIPPESQAASSRLGRLRAEGI